MILKADEHFRHKFNNEYYLFHENLRALKATLSVQAAEITATEISELPTTEISELPATATELPVSKISAPVLSTPTAPPQKDSDLCDFESERFKKIVALVSNPIKDSTLDESLEKFNKTDLEEFWKEADVMLVEALEDKEETGFKVDVVDLVPVTKKTANKRVRKCVFKPNKRAAVAKAVVETVVEAEKASSPKKQKTGPATDSIEPVTDKIEPVTDKIEPVTDKIESVTDKIEPATNPIEADTIEISDDENDNDMTKNTSNRYLDPFLNVTTEQLMELTEMISSVLPSDPEEKRKSKKMKKNETYANTIKIDIKASKIINVPTSTPIIKKRRDSILMLPKNKKVKEAVECKFCSTTFNRKAKLKNHMHQMHKAQVTPRANS